MSEEAAFAGRILLALLLGGLVGVERELSGHPAGLRTHITVALGAALFGIVSTDGFDRFFAERATTNVQVDVTRVASQVVVGIGFLGAGTIVKSDGSVRGLTTAASLWVTAAIGLAVGIAAYGPAIIVTVVLILALVVLRWPGAWLEGKLRTASQTVTIQLRPDASAGEVLEWLHEREGITVTMLTTKKRQEGNQVEAQIKPHPTTDLDDVIGDLAGLPSVAGVEIT